MAETAQLKQFTDDLKAPQKASGLFFGPLISFDAISDLRKGSPKPCHMHLAVQVEILSFFAFVLLGTHVSVGIPSLSAQANWLKDMYSIGI